MQELQATESEPSKRKPTVLTAVWGVGCDIIGVRRNVALQLGIRKTVTRYPNAASDERCYFGALFSVLAKLLALNERKN